MPHTQQQECCTALLAMAACRRSFHSLIIVQFWPHKNNLAKHTLSKFLALPFLVAQMPRNGDELLLECYTPPYVFSDIFRPAVHHFIGEGFPSLQCRRLECCVQDQSQEEERSLGWIRLFLWSMSKILQATMSRHGVTLLCLKCTSSPPLLSLYHHQHVRMRGR